MALDLVGRWAFIAGVILAIILGLLGELSATMTIVLVVIGLIVGLLNVAAEEVKDFLFAVVALAIVSFVGVDPIEAAIPLLGNVISAIMVLLVPATIVVALKQALSIAKA